jgi:hypothetical protein
VARLNSRKILFQPACALPTRPAGLRARTGVRGLLQVVAGGLVFVDEATGTEEQLPAPVSGAIMPEMRHHVRVSDPVVCRIYFYRAPFDA